MASFNWPGTSGSGSVTSINISGGSTGLTTSGGPITTFGTITLGGTLNIASGGTGQTTAVAAFNALSPNTTKGDITVYDTGTNSRLSVGADAQVLTADSTQALGVKWASPATSGTVTSVSVVPNNGITQSVANPTTTPAITLGLGAITPISVNTTNGNVMATLTSAQSSTGGPVMRVIQDDGSAIVSGTRLGAHSFAGAVDSSHTISLASSIMEAFATENWSPTATGTKTVFSTTPNTTAARVKIFTLDQNGDAIFGAGEGGTPVATTIRGPKAVGSNIAGANVTVDASNGTGTGGSGALVFRTAPVAASSSTPDTLTEIMRITPNGRVGVGLNNPAFALEAQVPQNTFGITQTDGTVTGGFLTLDAGQQTGFFLGSFTNHPVRILVNNGNAAVSITTTGMGVGFTANAYLPTSRLTVDGSLATKYFAYSANATLDAGDSFAVGDATSAGFTITIPLASGAPGREYTIFKKDSSGNTVTVAMTGADKINGAASYTGLSAQYKFVTIKSDTVANWFIIGSN